MDCIKSGNYLLTVILEQHTPEVSSSNDSNFKQEEIKPIPEIMRHINDRMKQLMTTSIIVIVIIYIFNLFIGLGFSIWPNKLSNGPSMNLSSIEKLLEQIINQLNKTSNEIRQDSPPHF